MNTYLVANSIEPRARAFSPNKLQTLANNSPFLLSQAFFFKERVRKFVYNPTGVCSYIYCTPRL